MKNLQAAAATFLSSTELLAWEPGHQARAVSLLERFSTGQLDERALRAALGADGRHAAPRAPTQRTAVLRLRGVLTPDESIFSFLGIGTPLRSFMSDLRAASADPAVASIALLVDSPGGQIDMVPEAAALLRTVRARKPIVSAVSGLNASAAYWISSNSTKIEATPSAQIGSVGVYGQRA
jgi:ClpP class serine protease